MARGVWMPALKHDPENGRLKKHLEEVDSRLENLEKLKGGENDQTKP